MGQRIDVNHLNIFYGDFLAVEDVNINIEANKVTAFIGPSGCGKSTVLRTLDRMHEIIPGAHCEGEVLLEGKNLYDRMWIRSPSVVTSAWCSNVRTRSRPCPFARTCWPV